MLVSEQEIEKEEKGAGSPDLHMKGLDYGV
jgi:hypothetical protein